MASDKAALPPIASGITQRSVNERCASQRLPLAPAIAAKMAPAADFAQPGAFLLSKSLSGSWWGSRPTAVSCFSGDGSPMQRSKAVVGACADRHSAIPSHTIGLGSRAQPLREIGLYTALHQSLTHLRCIALTATVQWPIPVGQRSVIPTRLGVADEN